MAVHWALHSAGRKVGHWVKTAHLTVGHWVKTAHLRVDQRALLSGHQKGTLKGAKKVDYWAFLSGHQRGNLKGARKADHWALHWAVLKGCWLARWVLYLEHELAQEGQSSTRHDGSHCYFACPPLPT